MRHGQSVANAHKIVSGQQESPLSELGRHQARISAEKLAHLNIDLIVCSPMHRAVDTAKIVADTLQYPHSEIRILKELRERDLGELEGKSYATDHSLTGDTPAAEKAQGIEPIEQFHSRIHAGLREVASTRHHQNVLIICHNGVGRMLQVIVSNRPALDMYEIPVLENAHPIRIV